MSKFTLPKYSSTSLVLSRSKSKIEIKRSKNKKISSDKFVTQRKPGTSETISSVIVSSVPATSTGAVESGLRRQGFSEAEVSNGEMKKRIVPSPPTGTLSGKPKQSSIKPPPQFNLPTCTAFPGTKEWDEYWDQFNSSIKEYKKGMDEYERILNIHFKDDLDFYRKRLYKTNQEQAIVSELGAQAGLEFGIVPSMVTKSLEGLQVMNGYVITSKNLKGTLSSIPGSTTGVKVEIEIHGIDPDSILTHREYNLLTMSVGKNQFLRIGTPTGKSAKDIEIWRPIKGILIMECS